MSIRIATLSDDSEWAELRARLWPDTSFGELREEALALLGKPEGECVVFLNAPSGVGVRAFAEAAKRHDHVNGCETSPVAFLEGIYVLPEHRGLGVGRRLLAEVHPGLADRAVQNWRLMR